MDDKVSSPSIRFARFTASGSLPADASSVISLCRVSGTAAVYYDGDGAGGEDSFVGAVGATIANFSFPFPMPVRAENATGLRTMKVVVVAGELIVTYIPKRSSEYP